jgi:hypothetical protein
VPENTSSPWSQPASTSDGQSAYTLLGRDGRPHRSATPGTFGGYRRGRIYGRLDCPSAQRAMARGHYVRHRVFFADAATALAAGYRPCAMCMPARYRAWKGTKEKRSR